MLVRAIPLVVIPTQSMPGRYPPTALSELFEPADLLAPIASSGHGSEIVARIVSTGYGFRSDQIASKPPKRLRKAQPTLSLRATHKPIK